MQDIVKILCFQSSKPISPTHTDTGTNKQKLGNTMLIHLLTILHIMYEKETACL